MNRALVALALFVVYVALAFGIRSWQHVRRTGSTGFHGISGRPGSASWFGGVLFVGALVLGALAPVLELSGLLERPIVIVPPPWLASAGVVTILLGTLATYLAQVSMGTSWRIGVRETEQTELVIEGSFRLVRNPIFTFMLVTGAGLVALLPNSVSLASFVCLFVAVELQVRVVEEPYLSRAHGERYAAYASRVGRFIPGLGRLRRATR